MVAKVIAVAQAKGGVGKSTLTTNLAVSYIDNGSVLVIDCDPPQHSLSAWSNVRTEKYDESGVDVILADKPSLLLKLINQHQANYTSIILDGPPHINAMTKTMLAVASVVLVPLAPSPVEIWSFQQMDALVSQALKVNPNLIARICWTRVRKRVKSSEYLIKDVKKSSHIKPMTKQLTQRTAYVDAFAEGLSVNEWDDSVARAEMWSLASGIYRLVKQSNVPNLKNKDKILNFSKS